MRFMMLQTMTPVVQLFGIFHVVELEISAVISVFLLNKPLSSVAILSLSLKTAI